jgi:RNA polymerase sigma-70 factor (ECF subfamily)
VNALAHRIAETLPLPPRALTARDGAALNFGLSRARRGDRPGSAARARWDLGVGHGPTKLQPAATGYGALHPMQASTWVLAATDCPERAVTEEERQITDLYKKYGPVVYRRCLRLLRDQAEAQDATQEVFVKLLKHKEKLADPEVAVPWIFSVASNHCLNAIRDQKRHRDRLAAEPTEEPAAMPEHDESGAAAQLLASADPTTRQILEGVYLEGREKQEVAASMGISRKTVTRRLERFYENAKRLLAGEKP